MTGDAYDAVPYTDHAYAEAHPDRLAVVARLSGWDAPEVATARVLDLGCGRGGHLLPMATQLPGATLVGVDRSRRQIDEAQRIAAACRLGNVTFEAASFDEARVDAGSFDYVTCHGLWSWIAPDARRALFATIARALSPRGVAYVSFNALPGWYERFAARDWLLFDRARGADPGASLAWLRDRASSEATTYRASLAAVAARLAETDRAYAVHEYLEDEQHPAYVRAFLAEAGAAGLAYLGDAIPSDTALELAADDVAARADAMDAGGAQQLVDFARNAAFRRALLVRADAGWTWPRRLDPRAVASMRVAKAPGEVRAIGLDPAMTAALGLLASAAPRSLPFAALGVAAADLFDLWLASGAVDLHVHEPSALAARVGARPTACPVARWHAAHGGPLTNLWHHEAVLPDPVVRHLLALLDGTRDAADLARAVRDFAPSVAATDARRVVDASLDLLARAALLVA